jgi:hypothetical protein
MDDCSNLRFAASIDLKVICNRCFFSKIFIHGLRS